MFNISRYSISHPQVISSLLVLLLFGGIYAFWTMGKREDSTFTIKSAVVVVPYAGATPEEVEELIAEPLERELRTLSYIHKITSESHFSYARLVVELHPATPTERIPQLWDELRRKVDKVSMTLPTAAGPISVADDFGDVYGLYYALVSSGGFSWSELREFAKRVERRLYAIDGVEKVMLYGLRSPEVNVWISPAVIASFDLRPEDVARAISQQNSVVGLGSSRAGEVDVELVEGSTYASLSDIENQLLIAPDGKQYRLGDIAEVECGYHTPPSLIMRVDGNDAIGIAVASNAEEDVVKVGDRVAEALRDVEESLPVGVEIVALYPENEIARKANNDFVINLIESVVIVVLLVMVAMGIRSGVVVGSSLLFVIATTLLAMLIFGQTLNRTSLAGFIIAMGMLVDNAIVVVDNTKGLLASGTPLRVAAVDGASRPRWALLSATLVAILSFLPLQIAESSVAEIISPLFIVVALSLLLSWLFALVQVPMMSVSLLGGVQVSSKGERVRWFGGVVRGVLRHRWLTLFVVVVLFVISLWAMGRMPQNFFPQLSKPYFRADVIMAEGYDIATTDERLKTLTNWLLSQPEVRRVSTTAGGTPPRYYLASGSYSMRPNYGNILVEVHDSDQTAIVEERFDRWVQESVSDVWLRSSLFRLSPVPEAIIEFGFVGENIDTLSRLTSRAMALMMARSDTRNVRNSWGNRVAEWQPRYSQIKAQRLGVERSSLVRSLEIASLGLHVATYREGDIEMPILLRSKPLADNSLTALGAMPIFSSKGRTFALSQAVSGFDFSYAPSMIRRVDSERVMKAQCDARRGVNTIALFNSLKAELLQKITLPDGYRMEIFGEQESRELSNKALGDKLPVTLLLIFVVLLLLFGNLADTFTILLCLPLIFIGVVAGLLILGKMFDFFSLLGLLGLVGMTVKCGVILLSRIAELRRSGLNPVDAVVAATEDRFIPVVTASATTVLGMTPLLFDSMFGGMAATIMGGLVVATLLVLVVLPVLYSLFYRIKL